MKKIFFLFLAGSMNFLTGCSSDEQKAETKHFPKPGTVVAAAQMPVTDDPLNHFIFSVKVIADSNVQSGVYDIDADFGPNFATSQLTMPQGKEDLKPILRKGSEPYTYIIGFTLPGDTTFYEYFEVSSNRQATKMRYLKAYSF